MASRPISRNRSSHGLCSPKCAAGSAEARGRPLLSAEGPDDASRSRARRRFAKRLAIAYAASWIVGVGFGYALKAWGVWGGARWELRLLTWFHDRPLPYWLDRAMLVFPFFGTNVTVLPAILIAAWWLWKHRREPLLGVYLLVVTVGSWIMNPAMKYLLNRDRPTLFPLRGMYNFPSYPSGHMILTVALYYTLALLLLRSRGWRWPFVVATLLIALTAYSRLYLSVHWPTDLIGGTLIGFTWLVLTWRTFRPFLARPRAIIS